MKKLTLEDRATLEKACERLEHPSLAIRMSSALGMPVETLDERWTTAEADRALSEAGRSGRMRRKQATDSMAATIILQN